jgi:hypothetical protein
MSEKIRIPNTRLWATKIPEDAPNFYDYFLWKVIDGSDTIVGSVCIYEDKWELDAYGTTFKGTSLNDLAEQYIKAVK